MYQCAYDLGLFIHSTLLLCTCTLFLDGLLNLISTLMILFLYFFYYPPVSCVSIFVLSEIYLVIIFKVYFFLAKLYFV